MFSSLYVALDSSGGYLPNVTALDSHPQGGWGSVPARDAPGDTRRLSLSPFPPLSLLCPSLLLFSLSLSRARALSVLVLVLVCVVVPWLSLGRFGWLFLLLGIFIDEYFFLSSFRSFLCRRMHTQTDFWVLKESFVLFGFRAPPPPPPPHVCSTGSRTPNKMLVASSMLLSLVAK